MPPPCGTAQGSRNAIPQGNAVFSLSFSCNCMDLLLQECSKQGLLSEANMNNLIDKRYSPLKSLGNQVGLEHLVLLSFLGGGWHERDAADWPAAGTPWPGEMRLCFR